MHTSHGRRSTTGLALTIGGHARCLVLGLRLVCVVRLMNILGVRLVCTASVICIGGLRLVYGQRDIYYRAVVGGLVGVKGERDISLRVASGGA